MNKYYDFTREESDDRFGFINAENASSNTNKAVSEEIWRLGRISNSYFSPKKISLITEIKTADEGIILHKISTNPHVGSAFYEFVNENELLEEGFKVNPAKLIGRYVLFVSGYKQDHREYVKFFKNAEDEDLETMMTGQVSLDKTFSCNYKSISGRGELEQEEQVC